MTFRRFIHMMLHIGLAVLAVTVGVYPVWAQSPEFSLTLSDTNVIAGDTSAWLSVFMQNHQDTLAGFSMRVILDRPDILEFRTDEEDTLVDTIVWQCVQWSNNICIDSVEFDPPLYDTNFMNGGIGIAGSIISDWEYVTALSLSPSRHDIKVVGFAENDLMPPINRGEPPREEPGLLFRMNLRIYESLPPDDSTVTFYVIENLSETNFSNPNGILIGTITNYNICDSCYCETWDYTGDSCLTVCQDIPPATYDTLVIDTFFRWWVCVEWGQDSQGLDSCLDWVSYANFDDIPGGVFDSISIDSIPWTVWNEETTTIVDGHMSIIVITCICGDANDDDLVNVGDPVYLIGYIFKGGSPPANLVCTDVNFDGETNVGDVVYLINHVFNAGSPPDCGF